MAYNLYCNTCLNKVTPIKGIRQRKGISYCFICEESTKHSYKKDVYCISCGTGHIVDIDLDGKIYCTACRKMKNFSEYELPSNNYECDICGNQEELNEIGFQVYNNCNRCNVWTYYTRKDINVSRRKKHHNKKRTNNMTTVYCQECGLDSQASVGDRVVAIHRYCKDCSKTTEYKKEKPIITVNEKLIIQHFKIFPFKGAEPEENIQELEETKT